MAGKFLIDTKITLNNGVLQPIFGFGMYQASGKAVVHALKSGYLQLDCAKFYRNENDIGTGIKEAGVSREKIFVVTKLFSTDGGRESAINAVEESLKLMKTDYIDQYLLHAPQGGKVLECYDVFLDYQKKGIIKSVGVSNFGVQHLNALKNSGRPLPQVNQIELHPWCQNTDIVKWCRDHNVAVVGYSPLSKGGKINHPFAVQIAKKYNKTPAQILIRWSLQKGFVTIPKSSDPRRIEENANVFDFCFTGEEMASFDDIGRNFKENCTWDPTKNPMSEFGPTK